MRGHEGVLGRMTVDEERIHVLTKYLKRGKILSDHNIMMGRFNLKFERQAVKPRIELFDFKNKTNLTEYSISQTLRFLRTFI